VAKLIIKVGGFLKSMIKIFLGIFISYLHPTGVAESTGKINEGDQIIAVNNISFLNINHRGTRKTIFSMKKKPTSDAVNILRSVDDFIVIELSFQPDKFHKLKVSLGFLI